VGQGGSAELEFGAQVTLRLDIDRSAWRAVRRKPFMTATNRLRESAW